MQELELTRDGSGDIVDLTVSLNKRKRCDTVTALGLNVIIILV